MSSIEPMLVHIVYFSLRDNSPVAVQKQLDACKTHLTDHPGTVFFGAGTRTPGLNREVNDKDFDVALHVVFKNRAAHDRYQAAPRHLQFIEESKPNWAKVRVFDADVEQ
jgi:Stress responsive A/B Barrel Domain